MLKSGKKIKNKNNHDGLLSLSEIAKEYSKKTAFISVLVQQEKLRAQRIGEHYFSTKEWFKEYLERQKKKNRS